ncbi:MAG: hypothetical protein MJ138_06790, partial [Kiritimatiellae bacterium]|nr:hypothetical protein [Kiritimatiellia bacterium]
MTPVTAGEGGEPPKVSAATMPTTAAKPTVKLKPVIKPTTPGTPIGNALKPGLKLPPKPTIGGLKPGLKLPPKPTIGGLKP